MPSVKSSQHRAQLYADVTEHLKSSDEPITVVFASRVKASMFRNNIYMYGYQRGINISTRTAHPCATGEIEATIYQSDVFVIIETYPHLPRANNITEITFKRIDE